MPTHSTCINWYVMHERLLFAIFPSKHIMYLHIYYVGNRVFSPAQVTVHNKTLLTNIYSCCRGGGNRERITQRGTVERKIERGNQ